MKLTKGMGSQPLAGDPMGQAQSWHPFLSVTMAQSRPVHNIGGQFSTISFPKSAMIWFCPEFR